jgi:hypothetical protein
MAFFGLTARTERQLTSPSSSVPQCLAECAELTQLIQVVNEHCAEEWIAAEHVPGLLIEPLKVAEPLRHTRTCAFCAADIWNR